MKFRRASEVEADAYVILGALDWWAAYITFMSAGQVLLAASQDRILTWDVSRPSHPRRLTSSKLPFRGNEPITCATTICDGRFLATGRYGQVVIWSMESLRRPRALATLSTDSLVSSVAANASGNILGVAEMDRRVTLWDISEIGAPVKLTALPQRIPEDLDRLDCPENVTFSRAGDLLGVSGAGLDFELWSIVNPVEPVSLSIKTTDRAHGSNRISFAADDRILLTCGVGEESGTARTTLWNVADPETPTALARIGADSEAGMYAAINPRGRLLVAPGAVSGGVVWDILDPGRPLGLADGMPGAAGITDVAFSPSGDLVATTHNYDHGFSVRIWRLPDPNTPTRDLMIT